MLSESQEVLYKYVYF